jgi:hypothetical protein
MSDNGKRFEVGRPKGAASVALIVIFTIIVVVVLIVAIILIRKNAKAVNTSSGTGSTQCVNNVDCSGTQVCDTQTGTCVDCLVDGDCPVANPVCNTATNKCVGCTVTADCPFNKPICNPGTNGCVQCVTSSDCGGATPICDQNTGTCVGCKSSADCPSSTPICNPANLFCVKCLGNSDCVAPQTCFNGGCCDLTVPSIWAIWANTVPSNQIAQIEGEYSYTQNSSLGTVVVEVLDHDGNLIYTSPGLALIGNFVLPSPVGMFAKMFFCLFQYQVRMRISQPCGITAFSPTVPVNIPLLNGIVPVINDANASPTRVVVNTLTPDFTYTAFYRPALYVSSSPTVDPNQCFVQYASSSGPNGSFLNMVFNWPMGGIAVGQQWYIRIAGQEGRDWNTISYPFLITVGP